MLAWLREAAQHAEEVEGVLMRTSKPPNGTELSRAAAGAVGSICLLARLLQNFLNLLFDLRKTLLYRSPNQ